MATLEDEVEVERTHPHLLAFLPQYAPWFALLALGIAAVTFGVGLATHATERPGTVLGTDIAWQSLAPRDVLFGGWLLAILVPTATGAVLRLNFRLLLWGGIVAAGGFVVLLLAAPLAALWEGLGTVEALDGWFSLVGAPRLTEPQVLGTATIVLGAIGVVVIELGRASHSYILTNRRFIARFGLLSKHERDVAYTQIDDLVIHQSFLGRLFNFGTVVPLTRRGKTIALAGDVKRPKTQTLRLKIRRGETVSVPRTTTFYLLYGVPDPGHKRDIIAAYAQKARARAETT